MCEPTAHVGVLVTNFGDILRFDVVKNTVSCDVMPYCLVECYLRFGLN
jgi:hypothetical protein